MQAVEQPPGATENLGTSSGGGLGGLGALSGGGGGGEGGRGEYRDILALSDRYPSSSAHDIFNIYRQMAGTTSHAGHSIVNGRDSIMDEFRLNGSDTDLDQTDSASSGGVSTSPPVLLRQASCPEPGSSSSVNGSLSSRFGCLSVNAQALQQHIDANNLDYVLPSQLTAASERAAMVKAEQLRQLQALPLPILDQIIENALLVQRAARRNRRTLQDECSFCKNNGEDWSYYSRHALKDRSGRVLCPVLRSYRCPRCDATGDHAHTIKYCPLSTPEDHQTSISVLKNSSRLSSGRRRYPPSMNLYPMSSASSLNLD